MNKVDAYVEEVIGNPYYDNYKYWQKVKYSSYGISGTTTLMFDTIEQALSLFVGYKFQI